MDFTYPPEAEAFRAEFRAWLDEHLTDESGSRARRRLDGRSDAERLDALRAWNRTLADARYAAIAWPEEWGGRGAGTHGAGRVRGGDAPRDAPGTLNPIGLSNIAPAIIEHGTDEQKRTLLPRMLRGDDIWCQGFSEPDAGSDLASLRTAAVRDGDDYVVNGQKTWNTLGHLAELVRAAGAHRSRRAEAPGHLVPARRHDAAGRRGAPARHDHRRARSSTRSSSPTCACPPTRCSVR